MASVLSSLLLSLIIPVVHISLIRVLRGPYMGVRLMFVSFALYLCLALACICYLNGTLQIPATALVSALSTSVFMCLFYMEAFSMIARGFSMRIITDIELSNGLTLDGVIENYGEGRGTEWLLGKRIEGLEKLKLIRCNDREMILQAPYGYMLARLSVRYKRILKLGKGG